MNKTIYIYKSLTNGSFKNIQNNKIFKRNFWSWLDHIWNNYDAERVKEVGVNRACTEWLLRCGGASVKYKNWGTPVTDYNKIPPGGPESFFIEEIHANNSCIMGKGFEYLKGLEHVKVIKLTNCELVDDLAMAKLSYIRNSLQQVELVFCPLITDVGLSYLYLLKNLNSLYIDYLPGVQNKDLSVKLLKDNLPNCEITFKNNAEQEKK